MRTAKSIAWTKLTSSKSDRTDSGHRHHARIRQPGAVARHGSAGRDVAAFARGLRPDSLRASRGTVGAACLENGGCGLLRGGVRPGIVHRRAHRTGFDQGTCGGHRQARGGGIEPGGDGHVWLGCAARHGAGCAPRRSLRRRLRRLRHGGGARNCDAVHGLAAHFAGRRTRVCIDGFQSIRAGARGHALCGSGRDDGPTRAGRGGGAHRARAMARRPSRRPGPHRCELCAPVRCRIVLERVLNQIKPNIGCTSENEQVIRAGPPAWRGQPPEQAGHVFAFYRRANCTDAVVKPIFKPHSKLASKLAPHAIRNSAILSQTTGGLCHASHHRGASDAGHLDQTTYTIWSPGPLHLHGLNSARQGPKESGPDGPTAKSSDDCIFVCLDIHFPTRHHDRRKLVAREAPSGISDRGRYHKPSRPRIHHDKAGAFPTEPSNSWKGFSVRLAAHYPPTFHGTTRTPSSTEPKATIVFNRIVYSSHSHPN